MEIKHFIAYGSVSKEETLVTIDSNIIDNSMVLEISEPFPGYHHNIPTDTKPNSVFLVLDKKYDNEPIFRSTRNIKKYYKKPFDAKPGSFYSFTDTYYAIRIMGLNSFAHIKELQNCYIDEGFKMHKPKKFNDKAIITVRKTFTLEKLNNDLYRDLNDANSWYVKVPLKLTWKMFETITYKIKNNIVNNNYDAALGYFYEDGIADFVRIYAHEPGEQLLEQIRSKYLEEIHNYINL